MLRTQSSILSAGLALVGLLALPPLVRAGDEPKPPAPGAPGMPPMDAPPAAPQKAGPPPPSGRFFDTYDANQDGKVTKEEFTGDVEVFGFLDKDGDGVVTLVELGLPADYKPQPLPKEQDEQPGGGRGGADRAKRLEEWKTRLAGWDTDKDGKVTKEEYKGKAAFETLDRNKDGVLTMDDLRGPGEMGGAGGRPPMSAEDAAKRFKDADKNTDGKVTAEEFPGPPERFATIDKNKDGAITEDEFLAAMKEMGGGDGGKGGKRMMMRFDKDADGKVSRAEFPGGDDGFQRFDKNGDGFITTDELEGVEIPKGLKGKKPGEPGTPPTPPTTPATPPGEMPGDGMAPPPAAPPATGGGFTGLFAALDKDKDGKLSRAEFPGTDEEWRKLDRDSNGWVTPDEAK